MKADSTGLWHVTSQRFITPLPLITGVFDNLFIMIIIIVLLAQMWLVITILFEGDGK